MILAEKNYDYCVLSGRGLCDGPIPRPEEPSLCVRICVCLYVSACVCVRACLCMRARVCMCVSLSVIKGNNNLYTYNRYVLCRRRSRLSKKEERVAVMWNIIMVCCFEKRDFDS